jgi:hypothetical protein
MENEVNDGNEKWTTTVTTPLLSRQTWGNEEGVREMHIA